MTCPDKVVRVTGRIYTLDKENPSTHEIYVKNGKIVSPSPNEKRLFKGKELIVRDGVVFPGFIDSHVHILSLGKYLESVDLKDVASIKELKEKLKEKVANTPPGEWVFGGGWDQEKFEEKRYPTRFDIDEVTKYNPVLLYRACRHVYLLNSCALEKLGINNNTPDPEGGVIDKNKNGVITGILREKAYETLVLPKLPKTTLKQKKRWLLTGLKHAASKGITLVQSNDKGAYEAYKELEREGNLPIRVMLTIPYDELDYFSNQNMRTGDGSEMFWLGRVKLFADGSLGGETAALKEPYQGTHNSGVLTEPPEMLKQKVLRIIKKGWEAEIHAIGDQAIDVALDAVKNGKEVVPREKHYNHVITHCQVTPPEIIEKMKKIGVIANIQPIFINTDLHWAEKRLGKKRVKYSYAWRSLLKAGIPCAGGSDSPIEPIDPLFGVYAAVTRKDLSGYPAGGWLPEQKLSIKEAIHLFTHGGAYAAHLANKLGTLKKDSYADFIILDRDIFEIESDKIKDTNVIATIVRGKIVYLAENYSKYISIFDRCEGLPD